MRTPTQKELSEVAESLGIPIDESELPLYVKLIQTTLDAYNFIGRQPGKSLIEFAASTPTSPDFLPEVKYPRTPGYKPERSENKHNAWYVKTKIHGASQGKLAGRTIALKVDHPAPWRLIEL